MPRQSPESKLKIEERVYGSSVPLLLILSGPSGVGKDAVLSTMKKLRRPFHYVITATTRSMRTGEKNGVHYHFLAEEEFQRMIDKHQFLEWANVYGNYYGVPKNEIHEALGKGVDVIVKVDVQGAATIKEILPQAVFIFLMPPSLEELEKRLRKRHSESTAGLTLRLEKAREEIKNLPIFDYVITSCQNKVDEVVFQIDAITKAEKHRVNPRVVEV